MTVVLKCKQNADSTIDGHIEDNGVINKKYVVRSGDCDDIQALATGYNSDFGVPVDIDPACQLICFGPGKIDP